jgi:hypothetical protein
MRARVGTLIFHRAAIDELGSRRQLGLQDLIALTGYGQESDRQKDTGGGLQVPAGNDVTNA